MKRIKKYGCFILILALLAVCFGCGENSKTKPKYQSIKVGICLYRQDDTFLQVQLDAIQKDLRKIEKEKSIKITPMVSYAMSNQSIQNDAIDRLIKQKVDVLCINLVDRTAASTVIYKAKSADIPLVFFNREPVKEDLNLWNKIYYVGGIDSESGVIQGKIVLEECKRDFSSVDQNGDGKIQYVMLEGEQGHQDALIRTEYSIRTITEMGYSVEKIGSGIANWQRSQAYTQMLSWLDHYPDTIELVMCNNDEMALGAVEACRERGLTKWPLIVGVDGISDAIESIEEGKMTGTAYNDGPGQAQAVSYLIYALSTHESIGNSTDLLRDRFIYLPYQQITRDNYAKFLKKS